MHNPTLYRLYPVMYAQTILIQLLASSPSSPEHEDLIEPECEERENEEESQHQTCHCLLSCLVMIMMMMMMMVMMVMMVVEMLGMMMLVVMLGTMMTPPHCEEKEIGSASVLSRFPRLPKGREAPSG